MLAFASFNKFHRVAMLFSLFNYSLISLHNCRNIHMNEIIKQYGMDNAGHDKMRK